MEEYAIAQNQKLLYNEKYADTEFETKFFNGYFLKNNLGRTFTDLPSSCLEIFF